MPYPAVNGGFLFGGFLILQASSEKVPEWANEKIKDLICQYFGIDTIQSLGICNCWFCGQERKNGGDLRDHIWKEHKGSI